MSFTQRFFITSYLWFVSCGVLANALEHSVKNRGKIQIILSSIWEGDHIKSHNVNAIKEFRSKFQNVPFVQFLSPAYFVKKQKISPQTAQLIKSTMNNNDMMGLHLHPWKSLVEFAGVKFKSEPTFWGNQISDCPLDCGQEVPLTEYSAQELSKLFESSLRIFSTEGFQAPQYFMAGGWISSEKILEKAQKNGMHYDFSPVPPLLLKNHLKYSPLYSWLQKSWSHIDLLSQPIQIPTLFGMMTQIPNNGATMDYLSVREGVEQLVGIIKKYKSNPHRDYFLSYGFYQETAFNQMPRLQSLLSKLFIIAKKESIPLTFYKNEHHVDDNFILGEGLPEVVEGISNVSKIFNNTRDRRSPNNSH